MGKSTPKVVQCGEELLCDLCSVSFPVGACACSRLPHGRNARRPAAQLVDSPGALGVEHLVCVWPGTWSVNSNLSRFYR